MAAIILQAGGQSTRMGQDKALLPFLGIPLILRLIARFQPLTDELAVVTNNFPGYQDLGLPLFRDLIPNRGALGGLYTALVVARQPLVGLVAADMPFASPGLMTYLINEIQAGEYDAVIPSSDHGIEPLHAVYRQETCTSLVKAAIDQDQWRMIAWHDQARIKILDPGQTKQIAASEFTFLNLNTPEEFTAAEKLARELEGSDIC